MNINPESNSQKETEVILNYDLVVTRHPALIDYLREINLINAETPVLEHVSVEDIRDKNVIGVFPLHLASMAKTVTEIPLDLPQELRGQELTLEQVRQYAGAPVAYKVTKIS